MQEVYVELVIWFLLLALILTRRNKGIVACGLFVLAVLPSLRLAVAFHFAESDYLSAVLRLAQEALRFYSAADGQFKAVVMLAVLALFGWVLMSAGTKALYDR